MRIPFLSGKTKNTGVKIHISKTCINCGSCTKVCPDIFRLCAKSLNGKKTVHVSAEQLKALHDAAYICPKACIDIIEE